MVGLLFAMMFKWLPDTDIAWGDAWLGAIVTAALFEIGKLLIGPYIGKLAVGGIAPARHQDAADAEQVDQDLHRQIFQVMLFRLRVDRVRLPIVLYQKVRRHGQPAAGSADHVAEIAKAVVIGVDGDSRIKPHAIRGQ
jgi:hypothetical protein